MSTDLSMEIAEFHKSMEPGKITTGEIECLRNIVNYLWDNEEKDFMEHTTDDRTNHIFKSVYVLAAAVNRQAQPVAA